MLTNYALPAGVRVAGAVAVVLLAASPVWSQTSQSQDAGAQATEQQVVAAGRSDHRRGAASPGRAGPPRRASRRPRRADGLLCRPHRRAALGDQQRPQHARAGCHRRDPQGRGLGPVARRLRAAAPVAADASPADARRCGDPGRPGRAGVRAPCPRRTPRPVLAECQLRCRSRPSSIPSWCWRPCPTTDAVGSYLVGLHPRHEQFQKLREALVKVRGGVSKPGAGRGDPGEAAGQRTGPQARHDACRHRAAAPAAQGAGRSRPRDLLRPGAEGGCGCLPAREQDDPRRGDRQPHALRAERQRAAQAGPGAARRRSG